MIPAAAFSALHCGPSLNLSWAPRFLPPQQRSAERRGHDLYHGFQYFQASLRGDWAVRTQDAASASLFYIPANSCGNLSIFSQAVTRFSGPRCSSPD